jgi:hypothetical protein
VGKLQKWANETNEAKLEMNTAMRLCGSSLNMIEPEMFQYLENQWRS